MKRFRTALASVAASALAAAAAAVPADAGTTAASPGWRVVYSHHYGTASTYSGYTDVAVVGAGDTWVLGANNIAGLTAPGTPVAVHWNGKGWSSKPMPAGVTGTIAASSVISGKDIWAVTDGGGYIVHWNGSKWLVAKHLPGGKALLSGITAINDHDIWVFGATPVGPGYGTWHYDGHQWKQVAVGVTDATATSPSNIWGVGNGKLGPFRQVDHYNGSVWTDVTPASLAAAAQNSQLLFEGAWAASSTSTWVTATTPAKDGARLWDVVRGKWIAERPPWAADEIGQPLPDGSGGFWVTASLGSTAWIWHRAARGAWSRIASVPAGSSSSPNATISYAPVPKTTSFWAAGYAYAKKRANSTATVWAYGPER
jgi:hypothetical protein